MSLGIKDRMMDNIKNMIKNNKIMIIIAAIIIILMILVVIITSRRDGITSNNEQQGSEEEVNNIVFSGVEIAKMLPKNELNVLKSNLAWVISQDTGVENQNLDVYVREDNMENTANYHDEYEFRRLKFFVDVDTVQRTYEISIEWSPNGGVATSNTPVIISCPDPQYSKYPKAKCVAMYGSSYKDYKEE